MQLVHNNGKHNHRKLLQELIQDSETSVLCSGWINLAGLKRLMGSIDLAIRNKASITVFSNRKHTEAGAVEALRMRPEVRHFIANEDHRYLHSKIYYFEKGGQYTALIGSGNITRGGLVSNEELSIRLTGTIGDARQEQISAYLTNLQVVLKR
ncbi:restriction endonuclease PLD domain-containing protein [Variovorax sp. CCNWLW186]|uniref:restriction endonuclease PLD domain-containing protein n=1 Tax=Variovorax sp. CCNWLW186 TaxID=3127473 RepID=UPI003077CC55